MTSQHYWGYPTSLLIRFPTPYCMFTTVVDIIVLRFLKICSYKITLNIFSIFRQISNASSMLSWTLKIRNASSNFFGDYFINSSSFFISTCGKKKIFRKMNISVLQDCQLGVTILLCNCLFYFNNFFSHTSRLRNTIWVCCHLQS